MYQGADQLHFLLVPLGKLPYAAFIEILYIQPFDPVIHRCFRVVSAHLSEFSDQSDLFVDPEILIQTPFLRQITK